MDSVNRGGAQDVDRLQSNQGFQYQRARTKIKKSWDKIDEVADFLRLSKFAKKFVLLSSSRLFSKLTSEQCQLINDKAYFQQQNLFNSAKLKSVLLYDLPGQFWRNFIPLRIRRQLTKIPVFLPESLFVECWQALKITCIFICYFSYLVCFAFGQSLGDIFNQYLLVLSQIIIFFDIFVTFNNGTYIKGILCTNRSILFKAYAKSTLYFDIGCNLLVFIYYIIPNDHQNSRYSLSLLLPILIKFKDISDALQRIQERFLLKQKVQNVLELVNLFKNILIFSHVFACIWIFVGKVSSDVKIFSADSTKSTISPDAGDNNWIYLMNLQNEQWIVVYIYSYYFMTVTMITVGYGDIRPINPIETIVCTIIMIIFCVIFGFTINSVGQIFQDFFMKEKIIREKRSIIGNYMNRKDISQATQKSVFEYLQFFWNEQIDESIEEEKKILQQLSDNLKQQVTIESNQMIMNKKSLFGATFSTELIQKCIPIIFEQNCTPGEILVDQKVGNNNQFLFFVQSGELEVINQQTFKDTKQFHVIRRVQKVTCFIIL